MMSANMSEDRRVVLYSTKPDSEKQVVHYFKNGRSPLWWATWNKDAEKMQALLALGADANQLDEYGISPAMIFGMRELLHYAQDELETRRTARAMLLAGIVGVAVAAGIGGVCVGYTASTVLLPIMPSMATMSDSMIDFSVSRSLFFTLINSLSRADLAYRRDSALLAYAVEGLISGDELACDSDDSDYSGSELLVSSDEETETISPFSSPRMGRR